MEGQINNRFIRFAADGREDGAVYDDELSKEKACVRELEDALKYYADASKYPFPLTGGMGPYGKISAPAPAKS